MRGGVDVSGSAKNTEINSSQWSVGIDSSGPVPAENESMYRAMKKEAYGGCCYFRGQAARRMEGDGE